MHATDVRRVEAASGCISRQAETDFIRIQTARHSGEMCSPSGFQRFVTVTAAAAVQRERRNLHHDTASVESIAYFLFHSGGNGFAILSSIGELDCGMYRNGISLGSFCKLGND